MLSEKAQIALVDIRDNVLAAQSFTPGMSFDEFQASKIHFYAVTRALEIVSEASRRLPDDFRAKHSSLPWKKIMGVGNVYRHDYDDVQEAYVWATIHEHLTPLLMLVLAEITQLQNLGRSC